MAIRHKRARLEQTKSDRAYRFLGLHTEQDVVETTRDLAVAEKPILRAHRKVRASAAWLTCSVAGEENPPRHQRLHGLVEHYNREKPGPRD